MKRRAFTLIELVMVITVIGIISYVTTAAIGTVIKSIQLNSAADKMAADLRYAQTMSHVTGGWYGVTFEVDPTNRYTVYTTTGTMDTTANNPAKNGTNFTINMKTDYNVSITAVTAEGNSKVEFSPIGTPYGDKLNISGFTTEAVVSLALGSSSKTVRITPNTGRIHIQ